MDPSTRDKHEPELTPSIPRLDARFGPPLGERVSSVVSKLDSHKYFKDPSILSDEDLRSLGLVPEGFRTWYKGEGASWGCKLPMALLDCLDHGEMKKRSTTPHETSEETLKYNYQKLQITQEAAAEALQIYYTSDAESPFMDDVPEFVYNMIILPRYDQMARTSAKAAASCI